MRFQSDPDPKIILEKMLHSVASTHTLTYHSVLTERVKNKIDVAENRVKIQVHPFKAYLFLVYPKIGTEVLYVTGKNNNKALIKPNKFPFVNINLDPHSSLMRDGQHHSLYELGFSYFGDIIKEGLDNPKLNTHITYKGQKKWENYDCYVISMENQDFGYTTYVVGAGENLIAIAKKLKVSEFMVMEINNLNSYYGLTAGQKITVPTTYAQKTILYIDKETMLPVVKAMFDEKGLYEKFEYKNLVKNPSFESNEFTAEFPGYGF
jgi:hypothetical protein